MNINNRKKQLKDTNLYVNLSNFNPTPNYSDSNYIYHNLFENKNYIPKWASIYRKYDLNAIIDFKYSDLILRTNNMIDENHLIMKDFIKKNIK